MRYTTGGVAHMAAVIEDDLQDRDTGPAQATCQGIGGFIGKHACLPQREYV